MRTLATMIAAVLALTLQSTFVDAQANSTSGHCTAMTVTDYVLSDFNDATNSQAWVNITDGHMSFTTSATGCVIITFSASPSVVPNSSYEQLHVRTLLDGNNLCALALSNDNFLESQRLPEPASSITRICKNVTPGTHTLQAQFRSDMGSLVEILSHVLTVTHN
jgi:hypothetical protein